MNIYVGNIAWSVSDDQLEELFSQYGTVTSAKIIIDKFSKRSRGFGFVEMADGGEQAIAELNDKDFEGRPLVVNESRQSTSSLVDTQLSHNQYYITPLYVYT